MLKNAKIQIFIAKSCYLVKIMQKNAQIATNYKFLKSPWPSEFKSAQIFTTFLKPKCVFKKNLKYANFDSRGLCKNLREISLKNLCNML